MIDIVNIFIAHVHLDKEFHRGDNVLFVQGKIFLCRIQIVCRYRDVEFFVQFIAPYPPQIITARGKEHTQKVFFRGFHGNRLAGHQHRIDGGKGVLFGRFITG